LHVDVLYRSGADAKDMPAESKRTPIDDVGMSRRGSAGGKPGFKTFDSEFDRSAAPKRDSPMSPTRGAAPVHRGSGVASSSSSSLQPLSTTKKYRLGQKVECNFKGMLAQASKPSTCTPLAVRALLLVAAAVLAAKVLLLLSINLLKTM
jgi:hypothetical protein